MPKKPPTRPVPPPTRKGPSRKVHVDFSSTKAKAKARRHKEDDEEYELAEPPPVRPSHRGAVYESRPANPGGVFLPDHENLIRLVAARGMSDQEIELIYGLGKGTVQKWKKHYPGLQRAIDEGRTSADAQVLFAMFKTATGYHFEEDQAVGGRDPCVLQVTKYKAGEFAAQKHWLGNRIKRPDGTAEWPRSEQVELSGPGGKGIAVESRNDLITAILSMVASKPDNEKARTNKDESGKK